jgi:hypothetical protein
MLFPPQTLIIKQLFVVIIQRNFFEMQARHAAMRPVSGADAQQGRQHDCDHIGKLPTSPAKMFALHALCRTESNRERAPLRLPGIF